MLPYNSELLIWIDDELGIEVVATSSGKTSHIKSIVTFDGELEQAFAATMQAAAGSDELLWRQHPATYLMINDLVLSLATRL